MQGTLRGIMGKMLDCDIESSEFELESYFIFIFRQIPKGKAWTPLFPGHGLNSMLLFFDKNELDIE